MLQSGKKRGYVVTDLENADSGESVVGYHKRFYRISLFLARAKGLPVRTPKIFEKFYGITRIFRKYSVDFLQIAIAHLQPSAAFSMRKDGGHDVETNFLGFFFASLIGFIGVRIFGG